MFRLPPKNIKSLPNLSVEQGQMGNGSSSISLSRTGIRRSPLGGCRFPDAILHGKRSFGLVAGPSSASRSLNFE
jgi:hypothetical protein